MVDTVQTGKPIDFSIMPAFRCNLHCWFCMYDCGPDNHMVLDYDKTKKFLELFDWSQINACGFYGGEPSIDMPLYDRFIQLIPKGINRFVISNGSWSTDMDQTRAFIKWCASNEFYLIVSSTPEHIRFQHRSFLENLEKDFHGAIELKKPDEIHAQGRAIGDPRASTDCKLTCQRLDRNIRLGLKPDGDIIFQNCHGEYHVIQTYNDPFDGILERTIKVVAECFVRKVR